MSSITASTGFWNRLAIVMSYGEVSSYTVEFIIHYVNHLMSKFYLSTDVGQVTIPYEIYDVWRLSWMLDPRSYSSAHPVPKFSQYLRLSKLVTSGLMGRNALTMIQAPRTEEENHMRKPSGKHSNGEKTSAISPVLFYNEQSQCTYWRSYAINGKLLSLYTWDDRGRLLWGAV